MSSPYRFPKMRNLNLSQKERLLNMAKRLHASVIKYENSKKKLYNHYKGISVIQLARLYNNNNPTRRAIETSEHEANAALQNLHASINNITTNFPLITFMGKYVPGVRRIPTPVMAHRLIKEVNKSIRHHNKYQVYRARSSSHT
jgi:hypothetical protein